MEMLAKSVFIRRESKVTFFFVFEYVPSEVQSTLIH